MFTKECETGFLSSNPKMALLTSCNELIYLLHQLTEIATDVVQFHKQSTLEALVILNIHYRDILITLIEHEAFKSEDFEWTRYVP